MTRPPASGFDEPIFDSDNNKRFRRAIILLESDASFLNCTPVLSVDPTAFFFIFMSGIRGCQKCAKIVTNFNERRRARVGGLHWHGRWRASSACAPLSGRPPPPKLPSERLNGAWNVLSYTRSMIQNFLAFRDSPITSYHPIKTLASRRVGLCRYHCKLQSLVGWPQKWP